MLKCIACDEDVAEPSEQVLKEAIRAISTGKQVHWDCPFCKCKDSVVGMEWLESVHCPTKISPNVSLYESARDTLGL